MTCDDLQFNLSFYAEDELAADERQAVEDHISGCPLCRIKLTEYRSLSQELRSFEKPRISEALASSIQYSLRRELAIEQTPEISYLEKLQNWLRPKMLPYGIGTFASLALFTLLALGILLPANGIRMNDQESASRRGRSFENDEMALSASKYASARSDVGQESPSLNPDGALVAMTTAMAKSSGKNREIVLVADVFSDGIARINEVVQSSPDEKTMQDLEKAMGEEVQTSPAFVPAELDKRSDVVQIVLKIQEVDVTSPVKKSARRPRPKI